MEVEKKIEIHSMAVEIRVKHIQNISQTRQVISRVVGT